MESHRIGKNIGADRDCPELETTSSQSQDKGSKYSSLGLVDPSLDKIEHRVVLDKSAGMDCTKERR